MEEKLYKVLSSWCKRSCTHLTKGVLSIGVQVLVLGVSKSGKENLKLISWGQDVGHKDRIKINLLSLCLHFFLVLFCEFYFPASSFI